MDYSKLIKQMASNGPRVFLTPADFLSACGDYFEHCEDNPLQEEQVNVWQGNVIRSDLNKVRAFTKQGLCLFLNIPVSRLASYKNKGGEWAEAMEIVENIIYEQKFTNAAAGLLNAGIITRDLGLTEKQEVESKVEAAVTQVDETPDEHKAIHVHPDDPDPLNLPRPMYSKAQLEAGVPFTPPASSK